jgi:nitroreductase/NAD-dependent dihydropyrimidine dehydrogenase PreA subunit
MLPQIDINICTDCQLCVKDCVAKAIVSDSKFIIGKKCILCGHCAAICPVEAITIDSKSGENILKLPKEMPALVESLIKGRRSVRHYKEDSISRETINKILETVNCSPTGTNSRMVGITVLDSKEKIHQLTDILMKHFEIITKVLMNKITYPFLMMILGREKTKKIFSYKKLISHYWQGENILTHDAPLLLIFHGHHKSSCPDQDSIIAATTAVYFAESLGIGTCFNGFLVIGIKTCRKARRFLKLPAGHRVYETFTAGYPKFTYKRAVIRNDLKANFV